MRDQKCESTQNPNLFVTVTDIPIKIPGPSTFEVRRRAHAAMPRSAAGATSGARRAQLCLFNRGRATCVALPFDVSFPAPSWRHHLYAACAWHERGR